MAISERNRERRREYRKANDVHPYRNVVPMIGKVDPELVRKLVSEIPEDTRSLTARLMNDPIPGDRRRSA